MEQRAKGLRRLRAKIDTADKEILLALAKRMKLVREIGAYKRAHGIPPLDRVRRDKMLHSRVQQGRTLGFAPTFVRKLFSVIHDHSVKLEKKLFRP
jgi:chorismate mutase